MATVIKTEPSASSKTGTSTTTKTRNASMGHYHPSQHDDGPESSSSPPPAALPQACENLLVALEEDDDDDNDEKEMGHHQHHSTNTSTLLDGSGCTTATTMTTSSIQYLRSDNTGDDRIGSRRIRKEQDNPHTTTAANILNNKNTTTANNNNNNERQEQHDLVANKEKARVHALRAAVLLFLISAAIIICVGVFVYAQNKEAQYYEQQAQDQAYSIIELFHERMNQKLSAMTAMSTVITSSAMDTNQTCPFVTIPNFAVKGSDFRFQTDSILVHYMPLVYDHQRQDWEEYALKHQSQVDLDYQVDHPQYRELLQDEEFGYYSASSSTPAPITSTSTDKTNQKIDPYNNIGRFLAADKSHHQEDEEEEDESLRSLGEYNYEQDLVPQPRNESILDVGDDEGGFHTKIWSNGDVIPKGDEPMGNGPYLPLWQRSPVNLEKKKLLNMDFAKTMVLDGALPILIETHQAILNRIAFSIPSGIDNVNNIGQDRHDDNVDNKVINNNNDDDEYDDGDEPNTFILYPVFDSLSRISNENNKNLVGAIATNIYWSLLFKKILPDAVGPARHELICVLENSFNQTISYLVDGPEVTYLGDGDWHDAKYDNLEQSADINSYLQEASAPESRSYTSVPLNENYGRYKLRIYPAAGPHYSNNAWVYSVLVACVFVFSSIVFIMFAYSVERRQTMVMNSAIESAQREASTARELNEFLSHEVRNPLSAAITASSFVNSAIVETSCITDETFKKILQDDVKIISTSLTFVNDFLRSMLDMHRAADKQMEMKLSPTDILKDILEPVSNMLFSRGENSNLDIIVECPENLIVMTDGLRLKQVILNLGRNASKFVHTGFIRFRATVAMDGNVELYVEDSGSGIPVEKQQELFKKFQTSLDVLSQGTGLGLSLCKNLITLLNGDITLDHDYVSGIEGYPGARFVIKLNTQPLSLSFEPSSPSLATRPSLTSNRKLLRHDVHDKNSSSLPDGSKKPCIAKGMVVEVALPEEFSVLFVDDDLMLRKLFNRAIKKVRPLWKVQEASNGETAIRMAETERFDLIFVDQYMASTEKQLLGTETVRELRSHGVNSILCGLSANDMESSFLAAGADAFVMKPMPCEKHELEQELMRVVSSRLPER